ncbi:hypothetical protein LXA43DRAFT_1135429 [Ganoderma leucocontextum]|nr:hypothetical protein LXA43DRAFT_1135429 [Ganoderma leucocontextum]
MNQRQELEVPKPQQILYQEPQDLLFIKHLCLPALSTNSPDPTNSTEMHYGVFRPLVLDACRVLSNRAANNQDSEDFLATDIQGRNRVEINDEPLDVDCYYFLGPPEVEANRNYPIVKTLSAFTFPSVLPDRWATIGDALRQQQPRLSRGRLPPAPSQMSNSVGQRDENCAITRWRDCALFRSVMTRPSLILWIALFVACFVRGGYSDLPDLVHRRPVTIHPDIPIQFLYARFAYAIINLPRANPPFKSIPEPDVVKQLKFE